MELSQLGELGLLAELERRGLAERIDDDAAQVDGLVVTQDALVEGPKIEVAAIASAPAPAAGVDEGSFAAGAGAMLALVAVLRRKKK